MNYIPQMYKALVPVGVTAVLGVLALFGIGPEMTVETALEALLLSGLVWLVPNK